MLTGEIQKNRSQIDSMEPVPYIQFYRNSCQVNSTECTDSVYWYTKGQRLNQCNIVNTQEVKHLHMFNR